jgi:hypothetical protein
MRTNNYILIFSGVNRSTRVQVFELFGYINQPKAQFLTTRIADRE